MRITQAGIQAIECRRSLLCGFWALPPGPSGLPRRTEHPYGLGGSHYEENKKMKRRSTGLWDGGSAESIGTIARLNGEHGIGRR